MPEHQTFVIVGAGLAGAKAAETLRDEGFDGRIVLIGEEPDRPYERPPLSKGYLLGKQPREQAYVHEPGWYDEHRVELRLGARAVDLDPAAHTVTLDGGEQLRYDSLLLTTGAVPRPLPVTGAELDGVLSLRRLPDSERIQGVLRDGARIVIVGAGWIGLEVAAAARAAGAAVTVVEVAPLPLHQVLGDEVAPVFADLHREHGVELRFQARVEEIMGDGGRVTAVLLSDGTELPADAVIVAVGAAPAIELAERAGLKLENGVVTDERSRTSAPDVYAAGDVANVHHPRLGRRIRVEHWANALTGGPAAAKAMLGRDIGEEPVPYFFTDQYDLGMEYAGYVGPDGYDQVVLRGDVPGREFIAFWLKDGLLLAGMNVNVWDVSDPIQAIIRAGRPVDAARLGDPAVPLESCLE
jgi:3-phenylpropionate/trans-cinnamate dioxygenase ferredoxin reductase subunit